MAKKINIQMRFSSPYVERRKTKKVFLEQVNQIIDWQPIIGILESYYQQGKSHRGRKAYPPLIILKMCLGVEEQVHDSFSFMRFCGLQLEDDLPDHSIVCRFRKRLNKQGAWDVLLQAVNEQLEAHPVVVKQGAIIDASITPTPSKPKGTKVYELTQEGTPPLQPSTQPGVDAEGSWVKKGASYNMATKDTIYVISKQA